MSAPRIANICVVFVFAFLAMVTALMLLSPAHAESTMQRDALRFPEEWQGEWCFSHADAVKRHVAARAGTEPFDATVPRSFYKRGRCKEDQKITIGRNRYSSATESCQLRTAHIAHVSVLELGGKVMCDFADLGNGISEHIRVSRRSDSLSVEFDGEITPYEEDRE